jgi:omega-amidase
MKSSLTITLIQSNLHWEEKKSNMDVFEEKINSINENTEIIILPEMFTTGFSMNPSKLAEPMNGPTVEWMKRIANKKKCILTGSVIIEENGNYYNRLIWMQPNGTYGIYDKRHLFSYAGENEHFTHGEKRLITQVNGWKICPQICYDLRFPIWNRQANDSEYDVFLIVANWPQRRELPWNTLLRARSIENQSYVIGCNRVGTDGNGIFYAGDSQVINPLGEVLYHKSENEDIQTITLLKQEIESVRTQFPFLNDKDDFVIL